MNDQTKVQAFWTALAPLAHQATQIVQDWRKYSRQAKQLTDLRDRVKTLTRSSDPKVVAETCAIVRAIDSLRQGPIAIHQKAAALVIELEDVLPLVCIEDIEREIYPRSLQQTARGISMMVSTLSEHCGPAPVTWSGAEGAPSILVEDAEISAIKKRVDTLEKRQQEIDDAERERSEWEQAAARQKAEDQKLSVVDLALKLQREDVPQDTLRARVFARMREEKPDADPKDLAKWWRDGINREMRRHTKKNKKK